MLAKVVLVSLLAAACGGSSKPDTAKGPPANTGAPTPVTPEAPADRCVQVADHFEPWRKNPDWAAEVSPRDQLISDCRTNKWSDALVDCLLASNSPLELDNCLTVEP